MTAAGGSVIGEMNSEKEVGMTDEEMLIDVHRG